MNIPRIFYKNRTAKVCSGGRESAKMLQFKIDPALLFEGK